MSGAVSAKSSTGAAEAEGVASPLAGRPAPKQMLLVCPQTVGSLLGRLEQRTFTRPTHRASGIAPIWTRL